MICLAIILASQALVGAPAIEKEADAILESSETARRAFWGIQVVDLNSGEVLYQRGQDRFFVPASNVKLFTTALALARLGPDHRFETRVTAGGPPDSSGRISGDLRLIGGGDPTLSAREIPYKKGPITGNPLRALEELADQVAARGVKRIDGDIVGDDTAYVWEPYPEGWSVDDSIWEYGAPVSALTINDNSVSLTIRPGGRAGEPARLSLSPRFEYYIIDNRVRTTAGGERKIRIGRAPGSRLVRLRGKIPAKGAGVTYVLAIDDPALYAASALLDALGRRGIAVSGKAVAHHRYADEPTDIRPDGSLYSPTGKVELARRTSPPLLESLRIINKVSQNLQAELVLREVARVKRNEGSLEAGLEELKEFLAEAGIEESEYNLEDGSGLSRLNLITPAAVMKILRYMYASEHRREWLDLLPIGGEDGTLSWRFRGISEARRIHAKTGTLSHVGALSGYAESRQGDMVAFSIFVNNYNGPSSEIRRLIDKISTLVIQ